MSRRSGNRSNIVNWRERAGGHDSIVEAAPQTCQTLADQAMGESETTIRQSTALTECRTVRPRTARHLPIAGLPLRARFAADQFQRCPKAGVFLVGEFGGGAEKVCVPSSRSTTADMKPSSRMLGRVEAS